MMPPRVSVIIATFNRQAYLRKTLASVYAQSFRDFEVVVVDDASSDGTTPKIRSMSFPRLTIARNVRNLGPSRSRNLAIKGARAPLVAFLDDDDLWRPGYLAAMVKAFRDPAVMFACSDNDVIDGRGRVTRRRDMRRGASSQSAFAALSGLERVPAFSATMVRKAAWADIDGFDENFRLYGDDSDFAFRLGLAHGPAAFAFVDKSLVLRRLQRRVGAQISSFDARQTDITFDRLLHGRKHRWWVDLLTRGG